MMQHISAPILVPGTQHEPTTPSLGATSNSSNRITSLGSSVLYHPNLNGRDHYHHAVGSTSTSALYGGHHLSSHSRSPIHSTGSNASNSDSGLKRFPSFGNTKKLNADNVTMRAKIVELERYLTGLKEELILAHRQIHAKNLEAKISQERKAVEIHELGQHIQRCEFDLLAKTAECEALQNKLQYQTKEQMTKLKHINLLENEIMDYRRMSILSGGNGGSTGGASGPLTGSTLGGFRNSRSSTELTESVRSSTILQDGGSTSGSGGGHHNNHHHASETTTAQMKELREENARKDEKIQSLHQQLEKLQANLAHLEQQRAKEASESAIVAAAAASAVAAASMADGDKIMFSSNNSDHPENKAGEDTNGNTVSNSTSNQSFNTASAHGLGSRSVPSTITRGHPSMASSINSVGYDISVEHPKLVARYQALRMQHAQASEYVNNLESENKDLKDQLLDVTASSSSVSPAPLPAKTTSTFSSSSSLNNNNNNALHHPSASGLTPLDTDMTGDHYHTRESTVLDSPSPTSATTASVGSPSTVVAPALTQKSSLRYTRDGQVSPPTTSTTAAIETTPTNA
ncbi:hypothetical protein EMPS_01315 [Entomortierella parvispora]|uniref:Uncharacterized protein n=1 Tax=Entomortierella parvispora TaxID=205924 RepID=A0A9P3H2M5_9FUNG|nr:hypothetical protein EMPS_01315 [Entomortierella parvispora]